MVARRGVTDARNDKPGGNGAEIVGRQDGSLFIGHSWIEARLDKPPGNWHTENHER